MNVWGSVEHSLDDKNRIRVPKRFRDEFPQGEKLCLVKYVGGCIAVFPVSAFFARVNYMQEIRSNNFEAVEAKRWISDAWAPFEEDLQGRAVLPAGMREYAGITKDVLTVGMGDYVEFWNPDRFHNPPDRENLPYREQRLEEALRKLPV